MEEIPLNMSTGTFLCHQNQSIIIKKRFLLILNTQRQEIGVTVSVFYGNRKINPQLTVGFNYIDELSSLL